MASFPANLLLSPSFAFSVWISRPLSHLFISLHNFSLWGFPSVNRFSVKLLRMFCLYFADWRDIDTVAALIFAVIHSVWLSEQPVTGTVLVCGAQHSPFILLDSWSNCAHDIDHPKQPKVGTILDQILIYLYDEMSSWHYNRIIIELIYCILFIMKYFLFIILVKCFVLRLTTDACGKFSLFFSMNDDKQSLS